ncbi:MAG: DUF6550 family protein, partial [Oscillospiraceae bacterium]
NVDAQAQKTPSAGSAEPEEITAEPALTPNIHINTQKPQETKSPATATPIPDQTDKTEQIIQADPVKPTETPDFTPTQEQLDSGEVPTDDTAAPTPVPAVTPTAPTTGGSPGQIYVPGFGWMDAPGESIGSVAEDMYENGNKVGIMD